MKPVTLVAAAAVIAVGGGAAVALWTAERRRAEEAAVDKLVSAAVDVLEAEELDAGAAQAALRSIDAHELGDSEPRLIRARTRLLLAMGRLQPAWDALAPLILAMEPQPEEMLLAARISQRMHCSRGDTALLRRAKDLAESHFAETGALESLFRAWQCAMRLKEDEAVARLAEALQSRYPETPQARLVAAIGDESTTIDVLRQLDIEFATERGALDGPQAPEELSLAVAYLLLKSGSETPDQRDVAEAIGRLQGILETCPSHVNARSLLAFALHQAGDVDVRNAHLDWLLENAPADDERRADWTRMREQPAGQGR